MRFFYAPRLKQYILLPGVITMVFTFILQFIPFIFTYELSVFTAIKLRLGYSTVYFPANTWLIMQLLFSFFYGLVAGSIGLLYFRLKHRRSGYTLLITKSFQVITGLTYLTIIYILLHTELFAGQTYMIPRLPSFLAFPQQTAKTVADYFISNFRFRMLPPSRSSYQNPPNNIVNNYPTQSTSYQPPQQPAQQPTSIPTAARMATAQELFSALNSYRQRNGISALIWDAKLGKYAQQRAALFMGLSSTDKHAGFQADLSNGLHYTLCFFGLSENSSYGASGTAAYLIEDWFGKSSGHNQNQLNSRWTHVGIGVIGTSTDFVFGGQQITAGYEHAPDTCK